MNSYLRRHSRRLPARPVEHDFSCANPERMLDRLRDLRRLRTDAELACLLGITTPTLSRIRRGQMRISAAVLLRMHEDFGLATDELRAMLSAD